MLMKSAPKGIKGYYPAKTPPRDALQQFDLYVRMGRQVGDLQSGPQPQSSWHRSEGLGGESSLQEHRWEHGYICEEDRHLHVRKSGLPDQLQTPLLGPLPNTQTIHQTSGTQIHVNFNLCAESR